MSTSRMQANRQVYAIFSLLSIVFITVVAIITKLWVLSAIPMGVVLAEFGPFNSLHLWMKKRVVTAGAGEKASLNAVTGWELMTVGTFLFGILTVFSNWATTYIYMMGAQSS